jgi:hypothetical protein
MSKSWTDRGIDDLNRGQRKEKQKAEQNQIEYDTLVRIVSDMRADLKPSDPDKVTIEQDVAIYTRHGQVVFRFSINGDEIVFLDMKLR